ncbi:MAG: pseudaminic acid biosynthesis-associated protein PseG [Caulobacter sp.]|nr:pseudaminic acid biosynthesis-associated protein PseG [Caulobacter sp.]
MSGQDRPRIAFVCAAGPGVGGGHVMRCATLAAALEDQGADCAFVDRPGVGEVLAAFAPGLGLTRDADPAHALVFDDYALEVHDHLSQAKGRPVLVIDDMADRFLGADMVLDAGPARTAADYAGLIADGTPLLLGPMNAPVRPEFLEARDFTLARRRTDPSPRRILVALGLGDLNGITERVVRRLLPLAGDVAIDVVLGEGAASEAWLTEAAADHPNLNLHVNATTMAALTAQADLAIGAGGSSTWERCVLGLPSLLLILAANQRPAARPMADQGAAIVVDAESENFETSLDVAVGMLLRDAALRRRLTEASAKVCDGRGAERVAEAFLRLIAGRAG